MTSVYGVTYIGAREQIKRRLAEKGLITDERLLFTAACYAAKVSDKPLGNKHQIIGFDSVLAALKSK